MTSSDDDHRRHHSRGRRASSSQPASPKSAFRECLTSLSLPPGLLSSVLQSYQTCDSRLWLIDNSSSMKIRDSHVGRGCNQHGSGANAIIERLDNVSRWGELQETVAFHAKMASHCWIPTKYWLVNHEQDSSHNKFALCWSSPNDIHEEMVHIKHVMKHVALDQSACPLASHIHSLAKGIAKEAPQLTARDRIVTVVLCTQGLPTDSRGNSGSSVRREFQQELSNLSKLPVKIIIRLCTDDERVRDMFNTMDSTFDSIDVLDDYWGEAMEVYLHNPWLTYGMGLHRLRESGFAPEVIDDIDERPLTLDEIHKLCQMLFLGEGDLATTATHDLPHPQKNWSAFLRMLNVLIKKEKPQWNPVKKATMPWIDLKKLEAMYNRGHRGQQQQHGNDDGHNHGREQQQRRQKRHTVHGQQQHASDRHHSREPPGDDSRQRRASEHTPQSRQQHRQQPQASSSPNHHHAPPPSKNLTLTQVLERWSHKPPDYKTKSYPLQQLLVTVPSTFPPTNTKVEEHEYFAKWKTFDSEAFADMSGDELKELLKRAVRKAKFFLHPDKLPKDLTENQSLLFQTMWNVIAEGEEAAGLG
ncbi:hypothetical protein ACHAXR_005518 [Thalassiosira sp. AJA248-18]